MVNIVIYIVVGKVLDNMYDTIHCKGVDAGDVIVVSIDYRMSMF